MEQLLRMEDICKSFSEVRVLNKIKLELRQGEVHALLGENGAGKSTLIKILGGAYTRDGGEIYVNGQKADITDVESAKKYGIRIIHQELMLISYMTIAENIFLGQEPRTRLGTVDTDKMNSETAKFLAEMELSLKPTDLVGKLNIAQQQMIEIIRAISFGAKIIVMDEPTSSLTDTEVEVLFKAIRKLKENGVGIIYISHRMSELDIIADRITVMRDGEYVDTVVTKETDHDKLVSLMVGRSLGDLYEKHNHATDEVVLKIEHLLSGREVRDVTFDLHKGEVLGFSGLVGSGRSEAMKCIFGLRKKEKGKIYISGKEAKINSVRDAMGYGIGLVPEDRKKDGLCTKLSIRHNIALPNLDLLCSRMGVVSRTKEDEMCNKVVADLKVKTPNVDVNAGNLSGGNQQKVVVGKWLARNSRVVIFDEPTRGIDVAAKVEIYNLMNQLKQQGIAVMFVSSEMPEVMGIADRIIVMCDGRITGELMADEATQNSILTLATRFEKKVV